MQAFYRQVDDLEKARSLRSIFEITGRFPENNAAEFLDENGRMSALDYVEYKALALRCAAALGERLEGVPKGGYVGLKLKNCPMWGPVFWGILMNGFCPVLLDAQGAPAQTAEVLCEAGAVAVVTEETHKYHIPTISPDGLEAGDAQGFTPEWADRVVFCSSGTRRMKLCVYDGVAISNQISAAREIPPHTPDLMYPAREGMIKNIAILPFHHIFGFVAVFLWYTFFGRTIVYPPDLRPEVVLDCCRRFRVTHLFGIPMLFSGIAAYMARMAERDKNPMLAGLRQIAAYSESLSEGIPAHRPKTRSFLQKQIQKQMFGTDIRFMISGGSYIGPSVLYFWGALGYPLFNGYGMTEAGIASVDMGGSAEERERGSIGWPLGGVEYFLHPERQKDGGGELCIRSPYLCRGVLEGGEFVPREGDFLETGDFAERDADGRYRIVGRVKEIIIGASGENIAPDELENHFIFLPGVRRMCALGVRHVDGVYERITLVVEPEEGADLAELRAAFDEMNGLLPIHKKVQDVFLSAAPLPVTATMKVKRQKLLMMLAMEPLNFRPLDRNSHMDFAAAATEETRDRVRGIFADILKKDADDIPDDAHFVFELGGDSFAYAGLIARIEQEFAFHIPPEQYAKYATVNEFAVFLDGKNGEGVSL